MKKYVFSFIVACLSLASSLMTFQAAAQENLTESQVRSIVEGALENEAKKAGQPSPISRLSSGKNARFEDFKEVDAGL